MLNFFNNLTTIQKSLLTSIIAIVLYVGFTGISYSAFSQGKNGGIVSPLVTALPGPANTVSEDPKEPKTEECPLNGMMRTKRARDNWEERRPLAVMIENHTEARPQSGLSAADIVYEAVAEGGITRLMSIYFCNLSDVQVGPVRSARTYYLDWLSEYDPLYAHVGGANTPGPANSLGQIIKYGIKDLDQFGIMFPTFWRDYQRLGRTVSTEHTMYSTTQKLWEIGAKRGWLAADEEGVRWDAKFTPWKFKDDSTDKGEQAATKINVDFWKGYADYSVSWQYDATCNCYKRNNGGAPHLDLNTNQQLSTKAVVIQVERESNANDGYENNIHLLYGTIGQGDAYIFQDGQVTVGKWIKKSRIDRTKYVNIAGKEVVFNRGVIWIQTVNNKSNVSY